MNFRTATTLFCLVASPTTLLVTAQGGVRASGSTCPSNPTQISQLPLVENQTTLKFPQEWNRLLGTWRATSGPQIVAERGCPGGCTGPHASLLPEGKEGPCFVGSIDLAIFLGLTKPGKYTMVWVSKNGAASLGPILITIEEPQGVDKQVYDKLLLPGWSNPLAKDDWPGWLQGSYTRNKASVASQILDKYPTSTYAGYFLEKKAYDYSSPLFKPVAPAEQVRMSRDEGKTVVSFSEHNFECYFKQLDTFMKGGRVPQSLAATLYGFYGDLLVQRGRFVEAEAAFKEAVKTEPTDPKSQAYYHRAQDFLTALGIPSTPNPEPKK
jgi:hypothetical protein